MTLEASWRARGRTGNYRSRERPGASRERLRTIVCIWAYERKEERHAGHTEDPGPVGAAAGGPGRVHPGAAQAGEPVAAPARRADQPVQSLPQPGRARPAPALC